MTHPNANPILPFRRRVQVLRDARVLRDVRDVARARAARLARELPRQRSAHGIVPLVRAAQGARRARRHRHPAVLRSSRVLADQSHFMAHLKHTYILLLLSILNYIIH